MLQVYRSFDSNIERERTRFHKALDGQYKLDQNTPALERAAAWYAVIALHDAWGKFCRQVVLTSARGGVLTKSGAIVPRSVLLRPGDDPFPVLRSRWQAAGLKNWGREGPPWFIPFFAIEAARLLAIGNLSQFSGAIASAGTPDELRACRNFLAHRHQGTATDAAIAAIRQRINVPSQLAPTGALAAQIVLGNITLFEYWCLDLSRAAAAAVS